jgi:glucosamine--fructose-6-phosphate aminotransferase (isomerizing)
VQRTLKEIKGSYALAIINAGEPRMLVAARKESPLILGLGEGEYFLASDIPAILPYTRRVIFLEDHDFVVLRDGEFLLLNQAGERIERPEHTITGAGHGGEGGLQAFHAEGNLRTAPGPD